MTNADRKTIIDGILKETYWVLCAYYEDSQLLAQVLITVEEVQVSEADYLVAIKYRHDVRACEVAETDPCGITIPVILQ